jgi:serine/threonine protein kinase
MEFAAGGDLYDKLQAARQFPLSDARIYIAQVLLALEHIHDKSFVHRDLKLENLLISHDGAIKLTDFGFAKKVLYRTWTLCGTPEYLAPEIVLEKGHNKAADYWALGVLLFEFLSG